MLNYTICKVDIPFYSCQFSIDGPSLNGHNVTIHAECSKNVRAEGSDDLYGTARVVGTGLRRQNDCGVCVRPNPGAVDAEAVICRLVGISE